MSDVVIQVENLSKQYRIGSSERYSTMRDRLSALAGAPLRMLRGDRQATQTDKQIWALKDVNFEVRQGEVVGIIGRNGAGKSTLLKILSRITKPTAGRIRLRGRVGSLLEVGTGFHPELTGRENIFLNGAMLGMRRAEITRKFDEIVAFAEVEQFIDTPVKRYSSGMYMRLAFAVAAHLEPEILVVDEVLAVGDAQFQRKCLGKMGEVAKEGRTVLFVSHQLTQIRRLCHHAIWLHNGAIQAIGGVTAVSGQYEAAATQAREHVPDRGGKHTVAQFLDWTIAGATEASHILDHQAAVTFCFTLRADAALGPVRFGAYLRDSEGKIVWGNVAERVQIRPGRMHLRFTLAGLPLRPGMYQWQVALHAGDGFLDNWYALPELHVAAPPMTHPWEERQGILNIPWQFTDESDTRD